MYFGSRAGFVTRTRKNALVCKGERFWRPRQRQRPKTQLSRHTTGIGTIVDAKHRHSLARRIALTSHVS